MKKKKWNHRAACAAALVLPLGLAACGDDADSAAAADSSTIEVVAVDFAFRDLPESVDAGTTLKLRNDSDVELHELVAFRLPDDETRSIDELMALPPEEMQAALGPEPATVILAPPASEQIAVPVGDGTLRETGRYAIVCVIPTGADPDAYLAAAATSDGPPQVEGGPPHIVHGMYAELEVR